jgi:oxaloacetate decarboxylase gamma subunit
MTIMEMLGQSGVLTILGMGVVFSFLIIMIITISGVGKIITALKLNNALMTQVLAAPPASTVSENAVSVTAAISAAVNEYRKNK